MLEKQPLIVASMWFELSDAWSGLSMCNSEQRWDRSEMSHSLPTFKTSLTSSGCGLRTFDLLLFYCFLFSLCIRDEKHQKADFGFWILVLFIFQNTSLNNLFQAVQQSLNLSGSTTKGVIWPVLLGRWDVSEPPDATCMWRYLHRNIRFTQIKEKRFDKALFSCWREL